tara:strand:+ start:3255 stop:3668 length:414 start_codon:yes stop_codon:yes gene_type:complete
MLLKVQQVPIEYVNQVWDKVEHFLEAALEYSSGDYNIEEVRVMVSLGSWHLIVATDEENTIHGALVVFYFNRPADRVGFVVAIGGKLVSNRATWAQFEDILRSNGATYLEGAGRESIVKLWSRYGMKQKYIITGKSL